MAKSFPDETMPERAMPRRASESVLPERAPRVRIEGVEPQIDGGRFPIKRVVGDVLKVEVDLVGDGHDLVDGVLRSRHEDDPRWQETPLEPIGNDRYAASVPLGRIGRWHYQVHAWPDPFATWREGLRKKWTAGQDVDLDLRIGASWVRAASRWAGDDAPSLGASAQHLEDASLPRHHRVAEAVGDPLGRLMRSHPDRARAAHTDRTWHVVVDVPAARFSAWYEFFPRSCGPSRQHGTFRDAERMLPYIADMGFDVVYLPPIHPIGRSHRKGPNNTLFASPDDPGSPWAIGNSDGGHVSLHPELGGWDDFSHFVEAVEHHGMALALDIAFQAAPDHPWVQQHRAWFRERPDGSIQYAENPPKKYQDIYPLDFDTVEWKSLWLELAGVFSFWVSKGVRVFRVDNPHTKSLPFWEWCITEIKRRHPEVLFLAEAFTRPKLMYQLAKCGFSQSYTYFTWRTSAHELGTYLDELSSGPLREFFRPNFWPNTPDILTPQLQAGHRSTFVARAVLASTMSSNWGIYGPAYELLDHLPRPGSEEYLDNEKYEIKEWDLGRPDSLRPLLTRLNRIRRENPALQGAGNTCVHRCDNDWLFCFSKVTTDGRSRILVVVNLHPEHKHAGWVELDLPRLGLGWDASFTVHDLLGDARYRWHGSRNYVELDPPVGPAHVFRVETDFV